jgi:CMP-N-acetylneuraminic acid synthetase
VEGGVMRFIAMIPARIGSKRIPKKNIRYMAGKPLIQYPIEIALNSGLFESVWLNSESEELGVAAEKYGAKFHRRPPELAVDTATNRDFTYEFLTKRECDYVVMVNPTSPLLRVDTLIAFVDFVAETDYDTVLSTIGIQAESFYKGQPLNFKFAEKINSQLLEPISEVVWALTAWKRETFIINQEHGVNPVFGGRVGYFPIPKDESCDLDTPEDWRIAEGILLSRIQPQEERYLEL